MSLEYAILGVLNYQSCTGYDLKKFFDASIRHFWPADQSQIYRTLSRLTKHGLTEMEKVPQDDRPDRKVYHITTAGRSELIKFLAGPTPINEPRSASLIQVFFAAQLSNEEILSKFEEYTIAVRTVLDCYEKIPGQLESFQAEIPSEREHFFWLLTLENGIRSMQANLEWAESVIQRIKAGELPTK